MTSPNDDRGAKPTCRRPRTIERIAAQKFHCPACGAEAHWNPRQARADLSVLRHRVARHTAGARRRDRHRRARPGAALRGIPDDARGWRRARRCRSAVRAATRSRSSIRTRSDSAVTSAARRRSCPTSRSRMRSVRSRCCRSKISESRARELIRAWYGRQWLAPNRFRHEGAHRHGQGRLSAVLDLRCERDARWTAESGTYYYVSRATARSARCDGRRRPASCRTRSTTSWCCASPGVDSLEAAANRAVSDRNARALRRGLSGRMDGRAIPDRPGRAASRSRAQMDAKLRALCGEQVPGRHVTAICRCDATYSEPDVQAHPGAGLAAELRAMAERRTRWSSTA